MRNRANARRIFQVGLRKAEAGLRPAGEVAQDGAAKDSVLPVELYSQPPL